MAMERVDSKAMQILTMYSDSDEEEGNEGAHGIGRKRRSTNEKVPETKVGLIFFYIFTKAI